MLALFLAVALAQEPAQWIRDLGAEDRDVRAKAEAWLKENGHRCKADLRKAWEGASDDDLKTRLGWILDFVGRSFVRGKGNPVVSLALTDDERVLLVGRKDVLELWDVEKGEARGTLACDVAGPIAVRSDGARVAFVRIEPGESRAPREFRIRMVDAPTGETVWQVRRFERDYALAFSPDGKTLAVSGGGFIAFLDAADGHELRKIEVVDGSLRHQGHGTAIAFDPDSTRFAYATIGAEWACRVVLLDLASNAEVASFGPFRAVVGYLRFGSDGKSVLATETPTGARAARTAKWWEVGRAEPVEATTAPAIDAVTADLQTLVGIDERGAIAVTAMESGKTARRAETGSRYGSLNPEGGRWYAGAILVLGAGDRYAAVALGESGDVGLLDLKDFTWR